MEIKRLHGWQLNISEAIELQKRLAAEVSRTNQAGSPSAALRAGPRFVGGVDMSVRRGEEMATASVVVLSYPELETVETRIARGRLNMPYIPGLLSFRELPLILAACEQLSVTPDLIMVDGQGIAHPRRFGIASHLGLFLDIPTIGCAKSLLCGSHETPGDMPGDYAEIIDNGETIGAALRTKAGVKPVYISIGHKIDLPAAIHWVMKCCRPARQGLPGGGYRLPEPTRLAHQTAKGSRAIEIREAISAGTER
ncbi:MAG: deoxyribonuclease V [Chloroflexi bacterium]|nr:deoxyribonuclease V [Chloroflexota bacterium]